MQPAAAPPQRPSAASSRGTVASGSSSSRQSPAAVTLRRLLGPAVGGSGSSSTAPRQPGILTRSAGGSGSATSLGGGSSSSSRPSGTAGTAGAAPAAAARQREGLHPHYAAVFLTDRSREQLLQHVAPLHETISADHMTIAYKPTPQQCRSLPLGQEAALFIGGVAADYRAQVGTRSIACCGMAVHSVWLVAAALMALTAPCLPLQPAWHIHSQACHIRLAEAAHYPAHMSSRRCLPAGGGG